MPVACSSACASMACDASLWSTRAALWWASSRSMIFYGGFYLICKPCSQVRRRRKDGSNRAGASGIPCLTRAKTSSHPHSLARLPLRPIWPVNVLLVILLLPADVPAVSPLQQELETVNHSTPNL